MDPCSCLDCAVPFCQESVDVDELCPICCAMKISVRFIPCLHASCRWVSRDSKDVLFSDRGWWWWFYYDDYYVWWFLIVLTGSILILANYGYPISRYARKRKREPCPKSCGAALLQQFELDGSTSDHDNGTKITGCFFGKANIPVTPVFTMSFSGQFEVNSERIPLSVFTTK